jgi:hypothetical protein
MNMLRKLVWIISIIILVAFVATSFAEDSYLDDESFVADRSLNVVAPPSFMRGEDIRGQKIYLAIKGMFRSRREALKFRNEIGLMADGQLEGIDFSSHYDGPSKGYWIVFSSFDSKDRARVWLQSTPLAHGRKTAVKKAVKHSSTVIPHNRDDYSNSR